MEVLGMVLLFLGMGIGVAIIPFGLPGVAVIFGAVLLHALLMQPSPFGVTFMVALGLFTVVAETADNWLMAVGAKRYGASSGSVWLSLLGGFLGGILLGAPLTIFLGLLGPFLGAFVGAFGLVVGFEFYHRRNLRAALQAGWGTLLGRMAGIMLKLLVGVGIVVAVSWKLIST